MDPSYVAARWAPRVHRQLRLAARVERYTGLGRADHVRRRDIGRVRVEVVGFPARPLLQQHRPPRPAAQRRGIHPRLERHPGREIEVVRIGDRDPVVDAIKRQRAAESSLRRPRRARNRAGVPQSGPIRHRAAAPLR